MGKGEDEERKRREKEEGRFPAAGSSHGAGLRNPADWAALGQAAGVRDGRVRWNSSAAGGLEGKLQLPRPSSASRKWRLVSLCLWARTAEKRETATTVT